MKKPEILQGPSEKIFKKIFSLFPALDRDTKVAEFLATANNEYWPWEVFKHKPLETEFSKEILWFYMKMTNRRKMYTSKTLLDKDETPFWFTTTNRINEYIYQIDISLAHDLVAEETSKFSLDIHTEQEEWKTKRVINSLIDEAITSSQIEGAATTRRVAKDLIKSGKKPRNNHERMIVNNYSTMQFIKKSCLDRELSIEMISTLHEAIMEGTADKSSDVTDFRKDETEDDKVCVYDSSDNSILFTPPPANEISPRLTALIKFINTDNEFMHPILKGILLHFFFAYIHPFYDGNGRTARALFYWYVLKKGYSLFEYISISEYIKKKHTEYQKVFLYTELDDNDLTYFINYNLKIIMAAVSELKKYIQQKVKSYVEIKKQLYHIPGLNFRQIDLLQHALKHHDHRYTIKSHQNSNNISRLTSSRDLDDLTNKGLLDRVLLGKELYFLVPKDFDKKIKEIGNK